MLVMGKLRRLMGKYTEKDVLQILTSSEKYAKTALDSLYSAKISYEMKSDPSFLNATIETLEKESETARLKALSLLEIPEERRLPEDQKKVDAYGDEWSSKGTRAEFAKKLRENGNLIIASYIKGYVAARPYVDQYESKRFKLSGVIDRNPVLKTQAMGIDKSIMALRKMEDEAFSIVELRLLLPSEYQKRFEKKGNSQ